LGCFATGIAEKFIGKHKPSYTPHIDGGDYVVVINSKLVAVTADKEHTKMYYSHSGYPGGLKTKSLGELRATFPNRLIEKAVYNMLPKNKLRQERIKRLKVFAGPEHTHQSQLPTQA
jgi:large subunit ribosomal protein L13